MSQVTINHQARRRLEDNLAMVFMGIVGVFLVCHILRVSLNIHEMIVIEHAMACSKAHKRSFPMWAIITNFFRSVQILVHSMYNILAPVIPKPKTKSGNMLSGIGILQ